MPEPFCFHELANGMMLLGQRMEGVASAAMTIVLPAGAAHDPAGAEGAAAVAGEWCFRGAGDRDTRALNDALDALGCRHDEGVLGQHLQLVSAQLGRNLPEVLAIYADVVRRPRLADETFGPCRALIVQDLASLEDEPARKCTMMVRERFYPHPLGRCTLGKADSLRAMTAEAAREHIQRNFTPAGTILAVAGRFEWDSLRKLAERHFGGWRAATAPEVKASAAPGGAAHLKKDSAQVHIALAHRAAPGGHERYYAARMAETILSGGMGARLFAEVREKRGLVYHVSSRYHSLKGCAGMFTYAGTTRERAQETLEVTVRELRRLAEGVEPDELARGRTQLKSALVMQGESTSARATAIAGDWYHLRHLRSLEEISAAIDAVTADDVLACLGEFPARDFTVLTIGPEPLDMGGVPLSGRGTSD